MDEKLKELFDLCREVYSLTEWDNYGHWYFGKETGDSEVKLLPRDTKVWTYWPLYDSDYLLNKMPQFLTIEGYDCRLEVSPTGYGRKYSRNYTPRRPHVAPWCAIYIDKNQTPVRLGSAETPLKALLKLTLELIEKGVEL